MGFLLYVISTGYVFVCVYAWMPGSDGINFDMFSIYAVYQWYEQPSARQSCMHRTQFCIEIYENYGSLIEEHSVECRRSVICLICYWYWLWYFDDEKDDFNHRHWNVSTPHNVKEKKSKRCGHWPNQHTNRNWYSILAMIDQEIRHTDWIHLTMDTHIQIHGSIKYHWVWLTHERVRSHT